MADSRGISINELVKSLVGDDDGMSEYGDDDNSTGRSFDKNYNQGSAKQCILACLQWKKNLIAPRSMQTYALVLAVCVIPCLDQILRV